MIFEHKSYRSYLKNVLADRILANPSYSLRAMARDINVSPGYLSTILNGEKNLSIEKGSKISEELQLQDTEKKYFVGLIELEGAKHPRDKQKALQTLSEANPNHSINNLSVDGFRVIAEWFHFAIIELTDVEGFEFEPNNIAKKLGITKVQVETALDRLVRVGLIESKNEKWQRTNTTNIFKTEGSNEALRSYYKQTLKRTIDSIENIPLSERYMASRTFAMNPEQMEDAKEIIREAIEKVSALAEHGKNQTELFHLGTQLFNYSHRRETQQ